MTTLNEQDGELAPRLFLVRTTEGNIWRLRHDLPDALAAELADILTGEPPLGDPTEPAEALPRLIAALTTTAPVKRVWSGPAWWIPDGGGVLGDITTTLIDDPVVLRAGFPGWARDLTLVGPYVAVIERGEAVTACCCGRTSERASEAGVETLEGFRGRGFASAVVAAWATEVQRARRLPLYSTSWDNVASQAVARRLGLCLYGADLHITRY